MLRARQRAQTRGLIIETALELMESNGFHQTTLDDIAAAVGMSKRTFFRYFESKADVLMQDYDDSGAVPSGGLAAAIVARPAEESITEALRAGLHDGLDELLQRDNGCKVRQLRIVLAEPDLQTQARDTFHGHGPALAAAFAERLSMASDDLLPRVLTAAFIETIWIILERWSVAGAVPERLYELVDEVFAELRAHRGINWL